MAPRRLPGTQQGRWVCMRPCAPDWQLVTAWLTRTVQQQQQQQQFVIPTPRLLFIPPVLQQHAEPSMTPVTPRQEPRPSHPSRSPGSGSPAKKHSPSPCLKLINNQAHGDPEPLGLLCNIVAGVFQRSEIILAAPALLIAWTSLSRSICGFSGGGRGRGGLGPGVGNLAADKTAPSWSRGSAFK